MRSNYIRLALLLALGAGLGSCKKETTEHPGQNPESPGTFESLNVPATFDWETNKTITVSLDGMASMMGSDRGVIVLLDNKGNILYKGSHQAKDRFEQQLIVPQALDQLRVKFGVTDKQLPINGTTVIGNLLPVLPEVL